MTRAMTKYKYDAFISYRHTELDKFTAELLHRQLEAFRLPGNLARQRKGQRTRINRVFRDKDELPLTNNLEDPIMQALGDSDYLIVICSPRLNESLWCRKEIETFISMHGREKVLAVLIEGEPDESFPEELLYREETVTDADGTSHVERIPMEPLAADIRGKDKRAMKKALKTELLRLLAPMFSLNYDDLRQRHRERRMKRILAASLSVGAVCLAFGTVSTAMALRIKSQNVQIQAQSDEILQQNEEIRKQNEAIQRQNQEITEQNETLLNHQAVGLAEESSRLLAAGDRVGAIEAARNALTSYQGSEMPYTPEAFFALTESLRVYDNGISIKPMYQMETMGVIYYMKLTPDGKTLMTYDNSQCLTVWDVESGSRIYEVRELSLYNEDSFTALGNDRIAYKAVNGYLDIYDITAGEVIDELEYDYVSNIYADREGKRIVLEGFRGLWFLNGETFEETGFIEKNGIFYGTAMSSDGVFLAFQEELEDESRILRLWNLETGEECSRMNTGKRSLKKILYRDGTAYVLLNEASAAYDSVNATVLAWDYSSGKILWEYHTEDYGGDILLPYVEGATRMLLTVTFEGKLLDLSDGSEVESFPYGNSIAGAAAFKNIDYFMVFTRVGELHTIVVDQLMDYYNTATLLSHSQNVKTFLVAENGFVLLPYQDNRVTYYMLSTGEDLVPYEGEAPAPESEQDIGLYANTKAQELGLVKAALATHIFYNGDESKLFVTYSDNTLEIYQTSDMTLLNTLKEIRGTPNQFLGTDKAGNMYIAGYSYGYMLDAQCHPLAVIEGLLGVDQANNRLIVGRYDKKYTVPIYTVEELLAKAAQGVL
ncbi:MAG: TIR domain-containing protein [Acetatifactor sp.]|nr:TIR domain-containing protein [Acetatifactor sp.]